jgi:hypothetical protein
MSAEMAEMLANMQKEKEKNVKLTADEFKAQSEYTKQAQRRYEQVEAKLAKEQGYDWTRGYEKWDAWEDPEDLAERENKARIKADQARMRTSCNHDHSAEQKLMDMSTTEKLDKCEGFRRLGTRSVSLSSSADLF